MRGMRISIICRKFGGYEFAGESVTAYRDNPDVESPFQEKATMAKLKPVTPGELLREEFLIPMGLSQYRLAKEIGVPAQRIGQIVAGKRAITAETDLRLCRFFGLSNGYWLRAQASHDIEVAEMALGKKLEKIKPWGHIAAMA